MKYAVNLMNDPQKNLSDAQKLECIAKAGFQGFFPTWKAETDLRALVRTASRFGLALQSVHAPFSHIEQLWEPGGDAELNNQIACLRAAAEAGAELVICHVFKGFGEERPNDLGVARFARLLDEAERIGVKVALENTEGEAYLEALHRALWAHPAAGFCWDSGHEQCYNRGKDMLARYGDKLLGTHLNDNLGVTGEAITWHDDAHLLPFDGIIDWRAAAERLAPRFHLEYLTLELTMLNKPNRHTHDRYAAMSYAEFMQAAAGAARHIEARINEISGRGNE